MAWLGDRLYVSTTRNAMTAPRPFADELVSILSIYPVKFPDTNPWDSDFRAQIWTYCPRTDRWSRVFRAPLWESPGGVPVPRQVGFRSMTTFKEPGTTTPAVFAASWSSRRGPGPVILRCRNGKDFEEVSEPGLGSALSHTIRAIVPFKGRLFVASCGRGGSRDLDSDGLMVLESADPASGQWTKACEPNFGDPRNIAIGDMTVFQDRLYAGTVNPYTGFEVWRTDAEGKPPYRWTKVISHGAYRGKLNEWVASMREFKGCLYVGGAILNCGHDRVNHVGPASPEVIRIHPDDTWELLVGAPRSTPDGNRVPLSGLGPGFNSNMTGYMWRMCEHDDWLYVTTADRTIFLRFVTAAAMPSRLQWALEPGILEKMTHDMAGFDMWRTRDGVQWSPVTRNGFGNAFNIGGRTMVSSPYGLFVGTANLFGPEVAVKRVGGWTYEPNPDGGAEVWLGDRSHGETKDPTLERSAPIDVYPKSIRAIDRQAMHFVEEYYGRSGFHLCGYWTRRISSPREACENLMKEILSLSRPPAEFRIPVPASDAADREFFSEKRGEEFGTRVEKDERRPDTVLDLACGEGATTRVLLNHFHAAGVHGVTTSKAELKACNRNAPDARFHRMKPTRLKFSPGTFDYVFCIEGVRRFDATEATLRAALGVLKPGGRLIGSQLVPFEARPAGESGDDRSALDAVRVYTEILLKSGYRDTKVIDATQECWIRFRRNSMLFIADRLISNAIDQEIADLVRGGLPGAKMVAGGYVIFSARRPDEVDS